MIRTWLHRLLPLVGLILFGLALWVLHHQMKAHHYKEVLSAFRDIPKGRVMLAVLFTVAGYFILTCYDHLAIQYIRQSMNYPRIALAAFIGYAFSNSIGHSFLTGGSVRYRLYSAWGLSGIDIAKVIAFSHVTFYLGTLILIGAACVFEPLPIAEMSHLPTSVIRPVGVVMMGVVLVYLLWSIKQRGPIRIRDWEFPVPSLGLSLLQIVVACLDLALVAAVLYALLPDIPMMTFAGFVGLFMVAQVVAVGSQVPGGLGVFESIMLQMLTPEVPAADVLGALLAYRIIYYILPLALAAGALGLYEVLSKRAALRQLVSGVGGWMSEMVPYVLAAGVFVAGALLLFSGATPAGAVRMRDIHKVFPLSVIEVSHFLGSVAGAALLVLAHGLQRRLGAAYVLTVALLVVGIVLSLLKGLEYEEAAVLGALLIVLLPCRREFYRKASLITDRLTAGWLVAIMAALGCTAWLVLFSFKHVEYSGNVWWQFSLHGDAPRALRAMVGASAIILTFAGASLLRPARARPAIPSREMIQQVAPIVAASPSTIANLALLGDKSLLFSESGNAFIMYGVEGRSWVVMGDPVGPEAEWRELLWRFREMCDEHDDWPVFYEIESAHLSMYVDMGLTLLKLGEEACVPLANFSLEGPARKELRQAQNRMEREGITFDIVGPGGDGVDEIMPELAAVSESWLQLKRAGEKGFSMGFFSPQYVRRLPVAILRHNGVIIAFANVWLGAQKHEMSVDLMRHRTDAPPGVMDALFAELMLWGKVQGYQSFNLGMAPLSGLENRSLAPLWNRIGAIVFGHGEHFYNFEGLRQYKEKFDPIWTPRYLASPAGLALPRILANIAALISGGLKRALVK